MVNIEDSGDDEKNWVGDNFTPDTFFVRRISHSLRSDIDSQCKKKPSLHPVRSYQFPSNESHDDEGDNNKESVAAQQGEGNWEEEKTHQKIRKSVERTFQDINLVNISL